MNTETTTPSATTIDVKEALKLLEKLANEKTYKCWIPTLQTECLFTEVTTGQQKELLKSIVDSPFYKSKFILTTYDILKDNIRLIQSSCKFDDLTIIDKQLMLLKMRIECFDPNFELTTDANVDKKVDLAAFYNVIKTEVSVPLPKTINMLPITVHVGVPTIADEANLEKELHINVDVLNLDTAQALRTTLGDIFISEISKYVTGLVIEDKSIDLHVLSFRDRIKVLEKVPNFVIQEVVKYIDEVKLALDYITTVYLPDQKTEEVVPIKFDIDGTFFTPAP